MPVTLADWLDEVLEQAPGCVTEVAKRALKLTGREFFRDSLAWQRWLGPVDAVPDTFTDFNAQAPAGAHVGYPLIGKFKTATSEIVLRPLNWERIPKESADEPRFFITDGPNKARVVPDVKNTKTAVFSVLYSIVPDDTSTSLPDYSYDLFHEAILTGTLARLFLSNDKAYSEKVLGKVNMQLFHRYIGRFRDEARRKYNLSDTSIQFPRGWDSSYRYTGVGF